MARHTKPQSLKQPGKCIFCGGSGLTKEHIFSAWMHEMFGVWPASVMTETTALDPHPDKFTYSLLSTNRRPGSIFTKQVRAVCGNKNRKDITTCNDGWMSVIETAAKPILQPLIRGERIVLNWNDQLALAGWIAVKTATAECLHFDNVAITEAERRFIWKNHRPPANWRIWLGRYSGNRWSPARWSHHGFTISWGANFTYARAAAANSDRSNSQASTFVIGSLLIHVISTIHPRTLIGFDDTIISRKLRPLWPPPRDMFLKLFHAKLKWPPNEWLNDGDAAFIDGAFFMNSVNKGKFTTNEP